VKRLPPFDGDELAPPPARREVDNRDFLAFARRIVAAAGRRAADDPEAFADLLGLLAELDAAAVTAAAALRDEGYSWQDIGAACGVSKQAAQKRWGRKD
jgi:hypothetical protein